MTLYSQRDSRWSGIYLGDNTALPYTIGNYGCLITCLSSYIDKAPNETNALLRDNKAFQNGGLFIWSKSTLLGLNQTYVSPRYDGPVTDQGIAKLKDILDQGYPALCEVDFNPNTSGEEMHFVLILRHDGDSFYAMDPWVGQIVNLSVYGGIKRAVIQFRSYDKKLDLNLPVPTTTTTPAVLNDQTKYDFGGDIGIQELGAVRSIINDTRRDLKSTQNDLQKANETIATLMDHQTISIANTSTLDLFKELMSRFKLG